MGSDGVHSPRIEPVLDPDEATAQVLSSVRVKAADGGALQLFATLAQHPQLLARIVGLGGFLVGDGRLPPRTRELVVLRLASKLNAGYVFAQHIRVSQGLGISAEECEEATLEITSNLPSEIRVAFLLVDEVLTANTVSNETWKMVSTTFDTAESLELLVVVGFYWMIATLTKTLQLREPT